MLCLKMQISCHKILVGIMYFDGIFKIHINRVFYRVFSTLLLPSYVTSYANACKMCEVFCCFFQPEVAYSCTCVCQSHYLCVCVYVSWPVATRSPRSVAFVTILNVSPGRQNEAKLAPIVATSVWLDILAARTLVAVWRVCEPLNSEEEAAQDEKLSGS